MRIAIITVAGISSRFNYGIKEDKKELKCIYTTDDIKSTLLYHLVNKCSFADKIIIVGGYLFDRLQSFCEQNLLSEFSGIELVRNEHYTDLGSGYSLYLGINAAMKYHPSEVVFVEGDLDIDDDSFSKVVIADKSVLTYTSEPIYANKAVVLYSDSSGRYHYAFNSSHGTLIIKEPFSSILNSGQTWKFTNISLLENANRVFREKNLDGTNLSIIQNYIDEIDTSEIELVFLNRWTNCNTREDYLKIKEVWEAEK